MVLLPVLPFSQMAAIVVGQSKMPEDAGKGTLVFLLVTSPVAILGVYKT